MLRFLNKPEIMFLHTIKWFQVLLLNSNNLTVVCLCARTHIYIYIYIYIYIVTWYPTEMMEVGWLLFELTVTWLGWHLVALTKSPDQGGEEEGRSQMIGWGPKTEVAPFSPSAKKTRRNVSYWKGLVADRPIAIYSG